MNFVLSFDERPFFMSSDENLSYSSSPILFHLFFNSALLNYFT